MEIKFILFNKINALKKFQLLKVGNFFKSEFSIYFLQENKVKD